MLSNFCNVIGGCKVSLIGHTDGKSFTQTIPVVRGSSVVEVTFYEMNTSDTYTFTAYAIKSGFSHFHMEGQSVELYSGVL